MMESNVPLSNAAVLRARIIGPNRVPDSTVEPAKLSDDRRASCGLKATGLLWSNAEHGGRIFAMCYSAQVIQTVRKLHRQLGIRLDYLEAEKLFMRRLDDPGILISRGFEANFEEPVDDQGRRIKAAIDEHRARMAAKYEKDLFSQKTRLVNAERSLKEKETKKAREDVRIAGKKIETITQKLSDMRRNETRVEDNRIFPLVYAGVVIRQDGENLLTPMRYLCRQAGKPSFYDKKFPGLYNALGAFLTVSC